jgi:2'-hydroxyisoflavone reductase
MDLLILGGLSFFGRHIVEQATERGHRVTTFTRGRQNADLYPEVEKLVGDRDGGLEVLRGRNWDAVIDTSGYVPRVVRASAELLHQHVPHYTFISSLSVLADLATPWQAEDAPVATIADPTIEEITGETYGPLKALCEEVAREVYGDAALVIRPGLIVGRYDPTDRFTYWPHRVAAGGEVLAPGSPDDPMQIVDAVDLAAWTLEMAERRASGTYHAVGPAEPLSIGEVLEVCREVSGSDATFTWIPAGFLTEHSVEAWSDLPAWVPDTPEMAGFSRFDCSRAIAAGLTFRPPASTVRDTLDWDRTRPDGYVLAAGLSPEREREALDAWHAQR